MTTTWANLLHFAAGLDLPAGDCQGFVANHMCAEFGSFVDGYVSANAALAASKTLGTFHEGTPPDGVIVNVFFAFPKYGHVGLYYNGETIWDSSHGSPINASGTIRTGTIAAYPYEYLGYATSNGRNALPVITPAPAPTPPAPNLRTTVPKGANLRSTPAVVALPSNIVSTLKGNIAYAIEKWQHGTAPAGSTNDIWFFVAGAWASATAFTSSSTDGILDGNPVAPPVVVTPPVVVPPPVVVTPVETPPVTVTPPASAPVTPPVIVDPTPSTPPPVVTPPATVTPTPPKTKPVTTPTTHPAAAPVFVAIVSAIVVAVGAIAAWIHTL
jgi:hypothetical protein